MGETELGRAALASEDYSPEQLLTNSGLTSKPWADLLLVTGVGGSG